MPSQDQLRELFNYNPETGDLIWRVDRKYNRTIGKVAGAPCKGYTQVTIDCRRYYAHRLVWVHQHGAIPEGKQLDHINHKKSDNRLSNLRLVTNLDNRHNLPRSKFNKSGYTGVIWHLGKWMAKIDFQGRTHYLGHFADIQDAAIARADAERRFGFHVNHGS